MSGSSWFHQMAQAGKEREVKRVELLRSLESLRTAWVGKQVYCQMDQGSIPGTVSEIRNDGMVYILWTYAPTGQSGYVTFPSHRIGEFLTLR